MQKRFLARITEVLFDRELGPDKINRTPLLCHTGTCDENGNEIKRNEIQFSVKEEPRLFFTIIENPNKFEYFGIKYSRFESGFPENDENGITYTIEGLEKRLIDWIEDHVWKLEEELEAVDPWEDGYHNHQFVPPSKISDGIRLDSINFKNNELFSPAEQIQVKEILDRTKSEIQEGYSLNKSEIKLLEEKIDELITAVENTGKWDWKELCWNVLAGQIVNISTNIETFQKLGGLIVYVTSLFLPPGTEQQLGILN